MVVEDGIVLFNMVLLGMGLGLSGDGVLEWAGLDAVEGVWFAMDCLARAERLSPVRKLIFLFPTTNSRISKEGNTCLGGRECISINTE